MHKERVTEPLPIAKLDPIKARTCQCERVDGNFMTLGPRREYTCKLPVAYFAIENNPSAKDGERGAMSLCKHCADMMVKQCGQKFATLYRVTQD